MTTPLVFTCPTCSSELVGTADASTKCPNCGRVFVNGVEVKDSNAKPTES
jgi:predicted RNA-binding Zn-ribbon protein involved in translation (DUF1610 family)